jgi:hypothetical protein
MFKFGLFKVVVAATFVDQPTGAVVGSFRMPLDRIPETAFGPGAALNMNGKHYVVVRAEPLTRAETAEKRRLRVVVREADPAKPG